MSIKITGFDEIDDWLNEMRDDASYDGFSKWANTIQNTAREMCGDHEGNRVSIMISQDMTITAKWEDPKALASLEKSIKKHLNHMSEGVKVAYTGFLEYLKKQ